MDKKIIQAHNKITRTKGKEYAPNYTEIQKEIDKMESPIELLKKEKEELYDVRMALNAVLFNKWSELSLYDVHKSFKHNDGELCFGGEWFIVCAKTPYGQISFHYHKSNWEYFKIPAVEKAKHKFDEHTTKQVIAILLNL